MHSSSVLGLAEFKIADLEKEGKYIKEMSLKLGFGVGKEIHKEILKVFPIKLNSLLS